jgi:NAD(P)-dependent dehydrogenase (short-subunit alcohol dehydrogenase family)
VKLGIEGKVALVTGGSRNIGKAISDALAAEGAHLIIASRNASAVKGDFTEIDSFHRFLDIDLMADNGPGKLLHYLEEHDCWPDIVVHNLGGALDVRDTFADVSDWERVWRYNLGIGHELNCGILPEMIKNKWGRVIHLSTLATATFEGNAAYLSAKCALEGYVKRVSKELTKHEVIMNIVAPGLVDLEGRYFSNKAKEDPEFIENYYDNHLPIRRMCRPAEVGNLVTFLCSDHGAYMPGAIVRIDGGGY